MKMLLCSLTSVKTMLGFSSFENVYHQLPSFKKNQFKLMPQNEQVMLEWNWGFSLINLGFSGGANGKEPTCQCRRQKRHGFDPWVGKIPWRRTWQPTPVFLPRESHGQRSLVGYSPWGCKESDATERLRAYIRH